MIVFRAYSYTDHSALIVSRDKHGYTLREEKKGYITNELSGFSLDDVVVVMCYYLHERKTQYKIVFNKLDERIK